MKKLKIAVLFGGCSSEYAISLKSAYSVIKHMDNSRYDVFMLGITTSGEWLRFMGSPEKIADDTWNNADDCVSAIISPCRKIGGLLELREGGINAIKIDAALPVLHGKNGEDGTVQGLLELAGIPVAGCGTLSSALCINKNVAHKMAKLAGIKVPCSFVLDESELALALELADNIGYPLFVKPLRAGSSIGISRVENRSNLVAAVKRAFNYDDAVIVEEAINGYEVGCAVLGNVDPVVGEVDEIELSSGFFDFHEKYTRETSVIHVPARIPHEKADEIKNTAKVIYKALGCKGFARVDMFLTAMGEIYFNEVNTIPGLTSHSRFPNMLKSKGITLGQIIDKAIGLAVGL